MFGFNGLTATLCALVSILLLATASADIVNLGQPCRAKNVLSGRVITDRQTGREMLVMVDMNETAGAELLFVDFEKNTGRKYPCPGGSGSWALNEVPGDRLVVGTFYDGKFMVFDLKKMEFVKDVSFPGESYIWNLALGSDGRIYGGSYGNGKLGALDLTTYKVEDLGNPAPPNLYCRNVSSLPDGRILCQFGEEKTTVLIFDPSTKKYYPVPDQLSGVISGITWHGYFLSGAKAYKGAQLEVSQPPFPTPPEEKGAWYAETYASNNDMVVIRQGSRVYTYRYGDKELRPAGDLGTLAARILGATKDGDVICLRGQDYFVMRKDKKPHLRPIPVESGPRPTHFLRCTDKGILWGGTNFGQTLWCMDPKTRKYENTGIICNAGGEAYDVAFKDGKVYAVTYAGGDIVGYDPSQPWNQLDNKNPKAVDFVGRDRGFIRPVAGCMFGPDGKLYAGWMAKYGTYGGAVSITDVEAGSTKLIKNPLGEQAICGLAVDSKYVYASTSLGGNGLPNKKGESAKFGIIDPATEKVVFEKVFDGAQSVLIPGLDAPSKRLLIQGAGKLMLLDTGTRDFLTLPEDTPGVTCHSMVMKDGCLYYGSEKSIIKLDVRKRIWTKLADAADSVANVAVGPEGTVYFSSGAGVFEVK